jgi:hypothetical protein
MHPALRLAGLAIEAELVAIRARTRAAGRRAALTLAAAGFGAAAVALTHLAAWQAAVPALGAVATAALLALADLAVAAVLLLAADRRDRAAEAAERTRDIALAGLRPALGPAAGLLSLAGLAASLAQAAARR